MNRFLNSTVYIIWMLCAFILLVLFVTLAFKFEAWPAGGILGQVFAALSGSAVVAIITLFLLNGQTRSENQKDQKKAIFNQKLEIYHNFLRILNSIVSNKCLSEKDEIDLQFQIALISIHAESESLQTISLQVNSIIRKLKLEDSIVNGIWKELSELVIAFHNELYLGEWNSMNVELQSAFQKFACLKIPQNYQSTYRRLLWLEDSISLYPVFTRIVGYKDLIITIEIKSNIKKKNKLSASQVLIVVHTNDDASGEILFYTNEQNTDSLNQILENTDLWKGKCNWHFSNLLLETQYIENAAILYSFNANTTDEDYLRSIYHALRMMDTLWWIDGSTISRRKINNDENNNIQIILSSKKINGIDDRV